MGLGATALLCAGAGYGFLGKENQEAKGIKVQIFENNATETPWMWSV